MAQSKRSWDPGRFVQTLGFFNSIPVVSWLQTMISGSDAPAPPSPENGVLFDFAARPQQVAVWGALDDVVMGGVSDSGLRAASGWAEFAGEVSTENSGGFASVRTRNFEPPLNLGTYQGITLEVQGDGQRYKFFLWDSDGWDAIAYGHSFDTTVGEWITVRVPFRELMPVFRAKSQPDARPLNPSQVRSLQLMLSKFEYDKALNPHFQPGPFCLQVRTIGVY